MTHHAQQESTVAAGPDLVRTPGRPEQVAGHRAVGVLVLLLLLTGATACGSSGDESAKDPKAETAPSTLDQAFMGRAEAACAPYADYQAKTVLNLDKFNRYAPDPALLPQVATHLDQNPAYKTLVSDLEGLGKPKTGATTWDAVLDDFRQNALAVQAAIDAGRAADVAGFVDAVGKLEQDKTTLFKDLQVAGLGGSSCAAAEVDPLRPPLPEH